MLSIGKIGAGAGHEYLSKGVTKDSMEYYGGKGERCGRWTGVEAEKLGLVGEIDRMAEGAAMQRCKSSVWVGLGALLATADEPKQQTHGDPPSDHARFGVPHR